MAELFSELVKFFVSIFWRTTKKVDCRMGHVNFVPFGQSMLNFEGCTEREFTINKFLSADSCKNIDDDSGK